MKPKLPSVSKFAGPVVWGLGVLLTTIGVVLALIGLGKMVVGKRLWRRSKASDDD